MSKKDQHIIIFDIDSSSIGGGLFRYSFDANNVVSSVKELYTTRMNIGVLDKDHFEEFFIATQKTLNTVARDIYLQSRMGVDRIYLNVSAPWLSAQKRIISKSEQTPFTITEDLLNEMIRHDSEIAFDKSHVYQDHKVSLVNRETVGVFGNGYQLRTPQGKEVSELEVHSLVSVMSEDTIDVFKHCIEKEFHRTPTLLSNTGISYQAITHLLPNDNNIVVIDISGYSTECTIIEHDQYKNHLVMSVGYEHIIDHLKKNSHVERKEAIKMFSPNYHKGKEDYIQSDTTHLQQQAFRTWYKAFHASLDTLTKQGKVPHTFLVRAPHSIKQGIIFHLLQQESLNQFIKNQVNIEMARFDFEQGSQDEELFVVAHVLQAII